MDNVQIQGFTQNGIDFEPTGDSSLFVDGSVITAINSGDAVDRAAVLLKPGVSGQGAAVFSNTRIEGNRIGLLVQDRVKVVLEDCMLSRNAVLGAWVRTTTAPATLFVKDSNFALNGPVPTFVTNGTALRSEGSNSTVRIATTVITGSEIGLLAPGGAILSYGDNQVSGNGFDGSPTGFITDI